MTVSLPRSHFNELIKDGRLKHRVDAFEHGSRQGLGRCRRHAPGRQRDRAPAARAR
ncbi:MAG: hypothetical protein WKF31_03055 [Thermoleophilaceae bacterium]